MKQLPPPKESCASFNVPIYDVAFHVIVTDDITRSRLKRTGWLGEATLGFEAGSGLCSYHFHRFAFFAERRYLCHDLIAHELFHLTHRILERAGAKFGEEHHEPAAYLCGWLTARVYRELRRLRERVNASYPKRRSKPGEPRTEHGR